MGVTLFVEKCSEPGVESIGEPPVKRNGKNACPKCGHDIAAQYGLAGGGIGIYFVCLREECTWFHKIFDDER